nr:hypothetical protein TetV2_00061 [Oceanusvirus sp.]
MRTKAGFLLLTVVAVVAVVAAAVSMSISVSEPFLSTRCRKIKDTCEKYRCNITSSDMALKGKCKHNSSTRSCKKIKNLNAISKSLHEKQCVR